jgi:DNA-binding PucR family transcriptional regulator
VLLDYDRAHKTDLVATVGRYLECGGNYDATARAMALGRTTVRYRLRRIRQLSGLDLSEPDVRFNLQLATRVLDSRKAI